MNRQRIIDQLKEDEGFTAKAFWDVKQWTYGYGCRAPGEGAVITKEDATPELEKHVDAAIEDYKRIFKEHLHKFNDVRAEAFVNLIFNMGPGRPDGTQGLLSFKNTLNFIFKYKEVNWSAVASGLKKSLWFRQVGDSGTPPGRGNRIVKEVLTGVKAGA
jgi:GH24 family phage-related lysozyme (muramidase)